MPKISAPTVAEHRSAQQAALLEHAEVILLRDGIDAVTPATVTGSAGLARSTFYEYFPSKDDLLVALARAAFERWGDDLRLEVGNAEPGVAQFRSYVHVTLHLTTDPRHALATALRGVPLSPKGRDDIVAMHAALDDPLQGILASLGITSTKLTASIVRGALSSAMAHIKAGGDVADVERETMRLLLHGVSPQDTDTAS